MVCLNVQRIEDLEILSLPNCFLSVAYISIINDNVRRIISDCLYFILNTHV